MFHLHTAQFTTTRRVLGQCRRGTLTFLPIRTNHSRALDLSGLTRSDSQKQTIYALSTPPGKAGIAIIRISGPEALAVRKEMLRTKRQLPPDPWKLHRCHIVHPETSETLDSGMAVFFPGKCSLADKSQVLTTSGPKTFTTDDVLELHIHSGKAVIAGVLGGLSRLPYCRPAEAGEFTERAFRGGRLDLTEVEGLKDLIDADTELQRRSALRSAQVSKLHAGLSSKAHYQQGTVRSEFETLRTEAIQCLAFLEALIDFGEGENIEEGVFEQGNSCGLHPVSAQSAPSPSSGRKRPSHNTKSPE